MREIQIRLKQINITIFSLVLNLFTRDAFEYRI